MENEDNVSEVLDYKTVNACLPQKQLESATYKNVLAKEYENG